jgi:hypothetical protein
VWPIILESGSPSCLVLGLYDFADERLGLYPGNSWLSDPPLWVGSIRLIERPV